MTQATNAVLAILGANVRALRNARGWSQEELAARAGLDRTYVGGIERGERNVSVINIAKLATALEADVAELVRGLPQQKDP